MADTVIAFHRSLRFRLIAGVVAIEVIMLSLLVWSNIQLIQSTHTDRLHDTALSIARQVANTAGRYMVEVDYASLSDYLHNVVQHPELAYVVVLDRDQRPVVSLGSAPADLAPLDLHPGAVYDGRFDIAEPISVAALAMGQVRMGFSLSLMTRAIERARLRGLAIAATEITLTVAVTVILGLRLTRRLGKLARAARDVGTGDYAVTVPVDSADEVGMTATAFNQMVKEVGRRQRHLKASLARERVIGETSIDGMVTYDEAHRILSVNPAMTHLSGYREPELIGRPLALLWEDAAGAPPIVVGGREEAQGLRKDGSRYSMERYIGEVDLGGEKLYAATVHDITERKQIEGECRALLDDNRLLIRKYLAVQEDERRSLSRELHDELGQCITAIQADAETIHDLAGAQQPRIEASARAILEVAARVYDVTHSMMRRLRPSLLDDPGLAEALREEVNGWRARHPAIDCTLTLNGELSALGERINITVYRVIQECLTNIAKHADAQHVSIALDIAHGARDALSIEVADDGRGMDLARPRTGLGLIGMRERVEAVGGTLRLDAAPGDYVRVRVSIPLPGEAPIDQESQ